MDSISIGLWVSGGMLVMVLLACVWPLLQVWRDL